MAFNLGHGMIYLCPRRRCRPKDTNLFFEKINEAQQIQKANQTYYHGRTTN
jgi:hypothetical protein